MSTVLLILTGLLAATPNLSDDLAGGESTSAHVAHLSPLTADEQTALDTAHDGRDHQESAFAALVSALSRVPPEQIDVESVPLWRAEQIEVALEEPDSARGAPALLAGRLEQSGVLERPWSEFREWFVRVPGGGAVAIYVPLEDDVTPGEYVRVAARFYKRLEETARDGGVRRYAAFVGRSVPPAYGGNPGWLIVILVVALLVGWLILQVISRRSKASTKIRLTPEREPTEKEPESTGLPSDPVAALDELARRRDDREWKVDS